MGTKKVKLREDLSITLDKLRSSEDRRLPDHVE